MELKEAFLKIMKDRYGLDKTDVEDWLEDYTDGEVIEGVTGESLAELYAEKYDLTPINVSGLHFGV